ncbi:ATP-binding cassette domain-containing protein [Desulfobacula phenolica]|uniref:ATP-binding cassette, subfamily C, LapB n=1 Tax=Desulfobacula phenolica TaxID=90732 RepID=A0A1H2HEN6_9BACT|nr:ATP-binding cassette domain-containing protein [Desulfobacula phenolica]SDU30285.1 ATP-binding cassette, subfamily C, LapB [Desulfobacula phenolica]
MKEFIRRFLRKPVLAIEIIAATFFITVLSLAMPLYVIQILNRYISYGFHGTLITLTTGMLIAILLQLGFRILRTKMARAVNQEPNDTLSLEVLTIVSQAKAESFERFSKPRIQEAINSVQTVQNCYEAQILNTLIDAPFSLFFVMATYLLSPVLAGFSLLGIVIGLFTGWLSIRKSQQDSEQLLQESLKHRNLNYSAVNAFDTVRVFGAIGFLQNLWQGQLLKINTLRGNITDAKELSQTLTLSGSSLTSVCLYAVGATIVVQGDLTVGALIGANILAGRAYQNITRLVHVSYLLSKGKEAFKEIALLKKLPLESGTGSALREYKGQIEFQDVGFAYPNTPHPVFESLTFTLEPGKALAVYGRNGSGKTTLAKLLVGLLEPRRGSILADKVNLQQLAAPWWRRQMIYMPQEPSFINGTIRENLLLLNPDLDEAVFNNILRTADLKQFLDLTLNGLDTLITDNGKNLPLGIRRRLSMARGLVTNGRLVIMDEPTDAMDEEGVRAVYTTMNNLMKANKTIIVFSNDPKILKGASSVLNLNIKPKPELTNQVMPGLKRE